MPLTKYEQVKRYRAKYPERRKTENQRYYERNKVRINKRNKFYAQNGGNLRRYKLTIEEYNALLQSQNGLCAICKEPESALFRGFPKKLSVDHDHKTGKVRGLLCSSCNRGIGYLRDSLLLAKNANHYLEKHGN